MIMIAGNGRKPQEHSEAWDILEDISRMVETRDVLPKESYSGIKLMDKLTQLRVEIEKMELELMRYKQGEIDEASWEEIKDVPDIDAPDMEQVNAMIAYAEEERWLREKAFAQKDTGSVV